MTDLITAAKAALDFMYAAGYRDTNCTFADDLRAAIEQAEKAEPVAWIQESEYVYRITDVKFRPTECTDDWEETPLYLHPAPVVPSGWQLVPKEPTERMMDAAEECSDDWPRTTWTEAYKAMLVTAPKYKAMLAAAPKYEGEGE